MLFVWGSSDDHTCKVELGQSIAAEVSPSHARGVWGGRHFTMLHFVLFGAAMMTLAKWSWGGALLLLK